MLLPVSAFAQVTGGVFSPNVTEGHRSAQYRATFDPEDGRLAQRIHYQQSLNGDFMLRGVFQVRESDGNEFSYDFFQTELFWDTYEGTNGYRTGFRFDVRIRSQGRPGWLGANWINQWALRPDLTARVILLTGKDVGAGSRDGIALGTRANVIRRLQSGLNAGLEMFSGYGTTEQFADFNDQIHMLGPVVSGPFGDRWSFQGSVLFGITGASPDVNFRLWLGRSF